jgi:hypothetical protein
MPKTDEKLLVQLFAQQVGSELDNIVERVCEFRTSLDEHALLTDEVEDALNDLEISVRDVSMYQVNYLYSAA